MGPRRTDYASTYLTGKAAPLHTITVGDAFAICTARPGNPRKAERRHFTAAIRVPFSWFPHCNTSPLAKNTMRGRIRDRNGKKPRQPIRKDQDRLQTTGVV